MKKIKAVQLPVPEGTVAVIEKIGARFSASTTEGIDVTRFIGPATRKKAFGKKVGVQLIPTKTGGYQWRLTSMSATSLKAITSETSVLDTSTAAIVAEPRMTHEEIVDFIKLSPIRKPMHLVMPDVKWKYLIRSAVRGKNILMTGPTGCGKTLATKCLQEALSRPNYYFNLGATQDPRSALIGNTHFSKEEGTYFDQSLFVTAIQTPNAIILVDELSRAHPDAWNILMTVFDEGQRYLRLDEKQGSPTIRVADGVTFVATANTGTEYTSTRVMDRALLDRFITIEMEPLEKPEELALLKYMFPYVNETDLDNISEIACHTRDQMKSDESKIQTVISTRTSIEMASLLYDGFTLAEAADVCVYPFFSGTGGLESEKTYMKQVVQKYLPTDIPADKDTSPF